jgi:hypothetical protein
LQSASTTTLQVTANDSSGDDPNSITAMPLKKRRWTMEKWKTAGGRTGADNNSHRIADLHTGRRKSKRKDVRHASSTSVIPAKTSSPKGN